MCSLLDGDDFDLNLFPAVNTHVRWGCVEANWLDLVLVFFWFYSEQVNIRIE